MGDLRKFSVEDLQQEENFHQAQLQDLYQAIIDGLDKLDYHKDKELLIRAKELFSQSGMMFEAARITKEIGISYYKEGNIAKAITYFENAVYILQNNTHKRDIQETLISYMTGIGVGYYELLYYDASLEVFQRCRQKINDKIASNILYRYYHEYGIVSIYIKNYEDAIELLEKALKYAENNIEKGYVYNDLGRCYWKMMSYKASADIYNKAIDLFKAEDNNTGLAMVYNNLSMLYYTTKDSEKATKYIDKCFELFDKSNPKKYIIYFDTYLRVILRKNDFGEAVDRLLEFIEISNKYSFEKRYILDAIELVVDRLSKFRNEEYGIKLKKIIIDLINENEEGFDRNSHYEERLFGFIGMLRYLFNSELR